MNKISTYSKILDEFSKSNKKTFNMTDIKTALNTVEERENAYRKSHFTFGKYKGKTIKAVHEFDEEYLPWLKQQAFYANCTIIHDEVDKYCQ